MPDAAPDSPTDSPIVDLTEGPADGPVVSDGHDVPVEAWSGVHRGPLREGEWVRLTDQKGRRHNFSLEAGKRFFSNRGHLDHDDLIGREEGFTIASSAGGEYLVFRPLLSEFVVSMPRGAAVVYPKDSAQIVALADIYPGARVVEAGVGSGALTCSLLRAVGPYGTVTSYERREEFAAVAQRNVHQFFGAPEGSSHPSWTLRLGDLAEELPRRGEAADRVILDMLAPWECVDAVADVLTPGGIVCVYVATTTQLSRVVETLRAHGSFTEPQAWESLVRDWHVEGLAVRPGHKMIGHTAFLVTSRRMAPGERPPVKKRRPAPGAYGPDYTGPRPGDLPPGIELESTDL
ncbi:MAG TPA: tRNA (adenine-N1)-methyltransferase [Nocardioides sp.]